MTASGWLRLKSVCSVAASWHEVIRSIRVACRGYIDPGRLAIGLIAHERDAETVIVCSLVDAALVAT